MNMLGVRSTVTTQVEPGLIPLRVFFYFLFFRINNIMLSQVHQFSFISWYMLYNNTITHDAKSHHQKCCLYESPQKHRNKQKYRHIYVTTITNRAKTRGHKNVIKTMSSQNCHHNFVITKNVTNIEHKNVFTEKKMCSILNTENKMCSILNTEKKMCSILNTEK